METLYPCPGCGFLVFKEPSGSYDICPVCGWEDDESQLRYPISGGGANTESLYEHQKRWLYSVPTRMQERNGYKRDSLWRPLRFEDYDVPNYFKIAPEWFKVTDDDPPYYWVTT